MSPSPGDAPPSPEGRPGGFAGVFKGLTGGAKLSRASLHPTPSASVVMSSHPSDVATAATRLETLSPHHVEVFELLRNGSACERTSAANTLRYAIAEYPLRPVLDIWDAAKDMIAASELPETRNAGWELLAECGKHPASTDLERKEYFQTLSAPASPDDFHLQLAALVDLTKRGRDLSGFDYDVLPLLTAWLHSAYTSIRVARKEAKSNVRASKTALSGKEKNLALLFAFVIDVVKFCFNVANDEAVGGLIDTLLHVCMNTSSEDDLRSCISVIDTIVTFGTIPQYKLKACVHVLSSIFCMVATLEKDSWHTISILCWSHDGQATIRVLLDVLRETRGEGTDDIAANREVRGALAVLRKILCKGREKRFPAIPLALLVDGVVTAVRSTSSVKVHIAAMDLINCLLDSGEGKLNPIMVDEDWSVTLEAALECSRKVKVPLVDGPGGQTLALRDDGAMVEKTLRTSIMNLVLTLEALMKHKDGDFVPRPTVAKFLVEVHRFLPDSTAITVLDYYLELRYCSPPDPQWRDNLLLVQVAFFNNRVRSPETRLKALQIIVDAVEFMDIMMGQDAGHLVSGIVRDLLDNIGEEEDVQILGAIVSLTAAIATSCDVLLFDFMFAALERIAGHDRLRSPLAPVVEPVRPGTPVIQDRPVAVPGSQTPSDVATRGFARIFMSCMNSDASKAIKAFDQLVSIAGSKECEIDARLTAMKLLFRLRADWNNHIHLTTHLDADHLADSLYRTELSIARKQAEDAFQTGRSSRNEHVLTSRSSRGISFTQGQTQERVNPIRLASTARPTVKRYHPMWSLPDHDPVFENVSKCISPLLVSYLAKREGDGGGDDDDDGSSTSAAAEIATLNMAAWLQTVLSVFSQGSDWEIYSFVLVHLPSQLSNHAIFRGAIPQIQELRKMACDHVRLENFQEPPRTSGLRRADVVICFYESLTMILSYHAHFQKAEEDEIVRTFIHGIGSWERSAKCCIHALSLCCHELPLSTSKSLIQMLNAMSTVITQPRVSIHILEFLACLSRMPNLFVNFQYDDYRTVFAICFRYLQYVRDKRQSNRNSSLSEPSTPVISTVTEATGFPSPPTAAPDDLPQYVHALAYHVILYWFLALKLADRPGHVGWIAKNLFADIEGSGPPAEEQALTTIDFMQRVAYADADESIEDPLFTEDRFGPVVSRRWLIGNSITTIDQATTTGWARVTKRQPSGTSSYIIRETFTPPQPHQAHQAKSANDGSGDGQQSGNVVLPSHLLVQLMSSIPQAFDMLRPIPLPNDDAMDRTFRVFDRHTMVDGHKVGVVYVGENQTTEAEILSNVSGSSDYNDFLNGLGTLTRLKGAAFNTQGLDREYGTDGQHTYCWRDRVTEIVFHVTTQMPTNLERDPCSTGKKRHIGNDFVNIIFNDSGLPFRFDTFPSDFNYVNIVITPEARASFVARRTATSNGDEALDRQRHGPFYKVQVISKPGFPEISPASQTKMISLRALPGFIRLVALNASVFSLVWANREGGEHIGSWRARLVEIKRLREKYGPKMPTSGSGSGSGSGWGALPPATTSLGGANLSMASLPPALQQQQQQQFPNGEHSRPSSSVRESLHSLRRTSVATFLTGTSEQTSHRSSMLSTTATNDTEMAPNGLDSVVDSVDFSKWA